MVIGTVGYRRSVSLITALRMGRASISASVGVSVVEEMEGKCSRTSSRSWVCQSGLVARSQIAQVRALLVVSCLKTCQQLEMRMKRGDAPSSQES